MFFFRCSPRPPTLSQRHMDLHVWAYPRLGYIFQVSSKSVQGFRSPRGSNLAFPITLAIGIYNSLYYRTSRDNGKKSDRIFAHLTQLNERTITACVQNSGGPKERPITYSRPFLANTVLCSFNTVQPSSS